MLDVMSVILLFTTHLSLQGAFMIRTLLNASVGDALLAGTMFSAIALAADTIKVDVLHSLSGTMTISQTTLKDTMLITVLRKKYEQ